MFASIVDEVEALAIEIGAEMRQAVQDLLLAAPVELGAPVLDEIPQVGQAGAIFPTRSRRLVAEPGPVQPVPQVVESLPIHVDAVRVDSHSGGRDDSCVHGLVVPGQ